MHIVFVHINVRPDSVEVFKEATMKNARNSIQEPGIARFDVLQEEENPAHFVLVEVYRDPDAQERHRETEHYKEWRSKVEGYMVEPRKGIRYRNLFPEDGQWS